MFPSLRDLSCYAFFMISVITLNPSLSFAEKLASLDEVNLITASGYVKDGVLRVSIYYKNRDVDEMVFWKEGVVYCEYEVYELEGSFSEEEKGARITTGDAQLKKFNQDFYIDIPEEYRGRKKWGLLECSVDTGYDKFRFSETFLLK